MADSKGDPEKQPPADSGDKTKKAQPPVQFIQPPSIAPPEAQPPQIITIKEPSFTQNLYVEVRNWSKSKAKSSWHNLRSDVVFCREAFKAALSESRWSRMIAAVTHVHKLLNWSLGLGVPAGIIALYVAYIYPLAGPVGTIIVVLSLLVSASWVTIRVTRRLYETTVASSLHSQSELIGLRGQVETLVSELASTAGRLDDLEKRLEPTLEIVFKPDTPPYEELVGYDYRQFRVAVVSPVVVNNAELIVNNLRVENRNYSGLHLSPRNDRNKQGTKRVALTVFKPEFWNVVSTPHWGIVLDVIPPLGEIKFFPGSYEFELMASGGESPPVTKIVNMEVDEDYTVRFKVSDGRLSEDFLGN